MLKNKKSIEELRKLTTSRLLNYYKSVRTYCILCDNSFPSTKEYADKLEKLEEYKNMIKEELATREHIKK